jgi:hypothetical protein
MRCIVFAAAAMVAVLAGQAAFAQVPAATGAAGVALERLMTSAFLSDACRRDAGALAIPATTDAPLLLAAFARQIAAAPPDARAEWTVAGDAVRATGDACALPVVALINLLRLNGVDADLVLVDFPGGKSTNTSTDTNAAPDVAPARRIAVAVYLPALDRYVDPAAAAPGDGIAFDRAARATAARLHVEAATVAGGRPGGCREICLRLMGPDDPDAVRVKTQVIESCREPRRQPPPLALNRA